MNSRPYAMPADFQKHKALLLLAHKSLQKHYNRVAKKNNGIVSQQDLEKAFAKVLKDLKPGAEAANILDAYFDQFAGALLMFGNSTEAFAALKLSIQ